MTVGVAAWFLAPPALLPLRSIIAFDAAAGLYLLVIWARLLGAGERLSAAAQEEDQGRLVMTILSVLATLFGMQAVITLAGHVHTPLKLILGLATIAISWLLLQTVFAAHYASLYRSLRADDESRAGLDFPGGGALRFLDFAYFAFTVGLTFQVSDVTTNTPEMRRVVMAHAVLAFVFNTLIIAIAVGLAASWIQR